MREDRMISYIEKLEKQFKEESLFIYVYEKDQALKNLNELKDLAKRLRYREKVREGKIG